MAYKQYGPEWEDQLRKISKRDLSHFFGVSGTKITKEEQIRLIREKLIAQHKKLWDEDIN